MSEFFDDEPFAGSSTSSSSDPGSLRELDDGAASAGSSSETLTQTINAHFPLLATRSIVSPMSSSSSSVTTRITCATYADRHFFTVSQTDKFGTLISAWAEDKLDGSGKAYNVRILQGLREDELLDVYAKQILARVAARSDRPLLLAIALRADGRDADTFRSVLAAIEEMHGWEPTPTPSPAPVFTSSGASS